MIGLLTVLFGHWIDWPSSVWLISKLRPRPVVVLVVWLMCGLVVWLVV